jgi:hypothetical protein
MNHLQRFVYSYEEKSDRIDLLLSVNSGKVLALSDAQDEENTITLTEYQKIEAEREREHEKRRRKKTLLR